MIDYLKVQFGPDPNKDPCFRLDREQMNQIDADSAASKLFFSTASPIETENNNNLWIISFMLVSFML